MIKRGLLLLAILGVAFSAFAQAQTVVGRMEPTKFHCAKITTEDGELIHVFPSDPRCVKARKEFEKARACPDVYLVIENADCKEKK